MADNEVAVTSIAQARKTRVAIVVLIALTVFVRLPGIGRPLVGNFATKNIVYAMVARNWAEGRASLWTPTLDCLAGGGRAWHLVEFPVSAYVSGALWRLCGGSLDVWGRGTSIAWSAAGVALLYLLVRRWHGEIIARAAAAMLALAPVSIIYGQSFMLESSVVALSLGAIYAVERWCDGRRAGWLALATSLLALLLLTKIYMLVLLAPLGWIVLRRSDQHGEESRWRQSALVAFATALAILPSACWYGYAAMLSDPASPTAERVYYSIRQSAAVHGVLYPLLAERAFYGGIVRNLATVALTPIGLVLLIAGFYNRQWRRHAPWLAACVVLLAFLPRKFHEMNYYYLVILPPLCVVAGLGWEVVTRLQRNRRLIAAVIAMGILCSLRYSLRPAFVTPAEDAMVVTAAKHVQILTRPDDWVIAMHGSTIDLLYYCDRRGLAIDSATPSLDVCLAEWSHEGAALLAVAQDGFEQLPEPTRRVLGHLSPLEAGPGFRLYRIADPNAVTKDGDRRPLDCPITTPRLATAAQD